MTAARKTITEFASAMSTGALPASGLLSVVPPHPRGGDPWCQTLCEFEQVAGREDNWDGEGAAAPSGDVIEGARLLLMRLRVSTLAPTRVSSTPLGSIILEWQTDGDDYYEIEVVSRGRAECLEIRGANPPVQFELNILPP